MLKPRLIPVLLFKNGILVRSQQFEFWQSTGDPIYQVERFAAWKADELIYLDISRDGVYNPYGTMQNIGSVTSQKNESVTHARSFIEVISEVSKKCFIPLTVGGKIRSLEDVRERLKCGADKVSINTYALENPAFITEVSEKFGTQCVVVSIDVRRNKSDSSEVFSQFGERATGLSPIEWAVEAERRGAGEILLNSIDNDGVGNGYDLELIKEVTGAVSIPVIALGGVGKFLHFAEGLAAGASAVAGANIFHFTEQSIINAKKFLRDSGVAVRL